MGFEDAVDNVRRANGWNESLKDYVDGWSGFIQECEEGYGFAVDEYFMELNVRNIIEIFLGSSELHQYIEMEEVVKRVKSIDERFKLLLQEEKNTLRKNAEGWWWHSWPKYGRTCFVDQVFDDFGVTMENLDN